MTVTMLNKGTTSTKTWSAILDLKGATISSSWSSSRSVVATGMQFANAPYNAIIAAAGTTSFGFCTTFTGTYAAPSLLTTSATY